VNESQASNEASSFLQLLLRNNTRINPVEIKKLAYLFICWSFKVE